MKKGSCQHTLSSTGVSLEACCGDPKQEGLLSFCFQCVVSVCLLPATSWMMNCEKCNMWTVVLQLVFIGVTVRIVTSCKIYGLVAACHGHKLQWVPLLPPNISHLYLERNRISEINSTSLQNLEQLFELDLGKQFVPLVIRNDAFLGQRHLVRLVLGDNLGLQLEPRAFAGMISLKQLFMDHCSLTDSILARNYLEPLSSLEELNLFDGWCLEAFTLAQGRMLNELKNVLVMVLVGKVAHYQLMKYNAVRAFVQRREYLTWPEDPQDLEWFYERLVSQILKDTDVKKLGKDAPKPENDIQLENIQAQK
ncbi:toll-like receptor 5 isoform X3 [Syngnathoides biaculeatus]|uniref:toll-like receptor 5 isoform X3 n=1 Tax=Syngnathoides biaculeatus TaxID=300417 RepID=UPI002ADD7F68|nr:toll-like receptor 5 isoform X3 [Syngnathoides biaculeatus]